MSTQAPRAAGARRILTAATELFGDRGGARTSLKLIAERAGVSPALIVHHYGSKAGLRAACDAHVAATVRAIKTDVVEQGGPAHDFTPLWAAPQYAPVLRYLARRLTEHSPQVDDLVDSMVDDAQRYTASAEARSLLRDGADARAVLAVLTVWSLGALVLHEHLERLIGADMLGGDGPPLSYLRAAGQILGEGILAPEAYRALHHEIAPTSTESEAP